MTSEKPTPERPKRSNDEPITVAWIKANCVETPPPVDPLARPVKGPCWIWRGALSNDYGKVWHEGQTQPVHRVVLDRLGEDLEGLDVDHLCRVRACCNPDHLEVVSRRENARRGSKQKHIVNQRCAHCGSTRGYARQMKGGEGWVCHDCALAKARAKRSTHAGRIESRAWGRAMYAEDTSINWMNYLTTEERKVIG